MRIQVGTSGYGYKEWKGVFYPEKISPKEMLHFYGEYFNTVEINYTFYHMPTVAGLTSWAELVPDDFTFSLKAPQVITHLKLLKNVSEETRYFFKTLSILKKKAGPVLFQLPGSFRANRTVLEEFLAHLPAKSTCAFEFRSKSWFKPDILELLRARDCSLCTVDSDEAPAEEIISTASWGYLRLRRSDYTEADLAQWLERILAQKWERAFVFFKHEEEAKGTELARRFQELADAKCGQETGSVRRDLTVRLKHGATSTGEPRMYGLIVKMTAAPGRRDDLIALLLESAALLPGCLSYVVAMDPTDANAIWITEVWDSRQSQQASLALPAVKKAIEKGKAMIASCGEPVVTEPVGGHVRRVLPGDEIDRKIRR